MARGQSGIKIKKSHRGKLHRDLGVPEGQKLTEADIQRGKRSPKKSVKAEANFAENAKSFKH